MPNNLLGDVSHAQVIHLGDNLSNHDPIYVSVKIDSAPSNTYLEENPDFNNFSAKPVWGKASTENINNYF